MIGLLADVGPSFADLMAIGGGSIGLSGPVGLGGDSGGDSLGLSGGVGLSYYAGSGSSVGLNNGIGLFA